MMWSPRSTPSPVGVVLHGHSLQLVQDQPEDIQQLLEHDTDKGVVAGIRTIERRTRRKGPDGVQDVQVASVQAARQTRRTRAGHSVHAAGHAGLRATHVAHTVAHTVAHIFGPEVGVVGVGVNLVVVGTLFYKLSWNRK